MLRIRSSKLKKQQSMAENRESSEMICDSQMSGIVEIDPYDIDKLLSDVHIQRRDDEMNSDQYQELGRLSSTCSTMTEGTRRRRTTNERLKTDINNYYKNKGDDTLVA